VAVAPAAVFATNKGGVVITDYAAGPGQPQSITSGPDGALWYTDLSSNGYGNMIWRMTTAGVVTSFSDPTIASPQEITAGPDGALWFTNFGNNSIGRITTSGVVSNFIATGFDEPCGITTGPDGALWFTNYGNNSIGRITPSGSEIDRYTAPGIDVPCSITAGPDGALWFTNIRNNSIGRITTAGAISTYSGTGIDDPGSITAGPDGALWFINQGDESIGRITTSGVVTNYTNTEMSKNGLRGITAGPDGALWFTSGGKEARGDPQFSVGRITTADEITLYKDSGNACSDGQSTGITAGSDVAIWFADEGSCPGINQPGAISRASLPPYDIVSPPSGAANSSVTITGGGFAAGESVKVNYETGLASPTKVTLCTTTATVTGTFSCSGSIPGASKAGATGLHDVKAFGATSKIVVATGFTLT